jgi:hypothetical protein
LARGEYKERFLALGKARKMNSLPLLRGGLGRGALYFCKMSNYSIHWGNAVKGAQRCDPTINLKTISLGDAIKAQLINSYTKSYIRAIYSNSKSNTLPF